MRRTTFPKTRVEVQRFLRFVDLPTNEDVEGALP